QVAAPPSASEIVINRELEHRDLAHGVLRLRSRIRVVITLVISESFRQISRFGSAAVSLDAIREIKINPNVLGTVFRVFLNPPLDRDFLVARVDIGVLDRTLASILRPNARRTVLVREDDHKGIAIYH